MDANVLERYIALEEQITNSEKNQPGIVYQQKTEQLKQLNYRIEEQTKLVEQLREQAWVPIPIKIIIEHTFSLNCLSIYPY